MDLFQTDRDERTPLHLASLGKYSPLLFDETPRSGTHKDRLEIIKLFIKNGADLHAKDVFYNTPLHLAVKNGHFDIVVVLTENGANIHKKNILGQSPFSIANDFFYREKRIKKYLSEKSFLLRNPNYSGFQEKYQNKSFLSRLRAYLKIFK